MVGVGLGGGRGVGGWGGEEEVGFGERGLGRRGWVGGEGVGMEGGWERRFGWGGGLGYKYCFSINESLLLYSQIVYSRLA